MKHRSQTKPGPRLRSSPGTRQPRRSYPSFTNSNAFSRETMRLTLEDALKLTEARKKKIRDDWIRVMEMKINREKLAECYRTEGVNSYEQCAHLAQTVISQIPEGRIKGFRLISEKHKAES
ncbi:hypothetical protein O181_100828 [Austropuccinia psidii MF-1]|uniref:Uncharacterized protein n=1 Tax=Austropuccinia psidii MF-1 TaxID=1389203 RepID=A0A9Q3JDD2_9BASI|nr:hypothetical protein [Austropuccinia psidii MF-1]